MMRVMEAIACRIPQINIYFDAIQPLNYVWGLFEVNIPKLKINMQSNLIQLDRLLGFIYDT